MERINEIMIHEGNEIMCIEDIKVNGKRYFTKDKYYKSPENNCLIDDSGDELFVQQQYLKHFLLPLS